jgi:hypothetical protein
MLSIDCPVCNTRLSLTLTAKPANHVDGQLYERSRLYRCEQDGIWVTVDVPEVPTDLPANAPYTVVGGRPQLLQNAGITYKPVVRPRANLLQAVLDLSPVEASSLRSRLLDFQDSDPVLGEGDSYRIEFASNLDLTIMGNSELDAQFGEPIRLSREGLVKLIDQWMSLLGSLPLGSSTQRR